MSFEIALFACQVATVGCAMAAGFFLTFSDTVMRSLAHAPGSEGLRVMQTVNREVLRSLPVVLLWCMLWLTLGLGLWGWWSLSGAASWMLQAGALAYLAGVAVVTFARNVPMNEHLDRMPGDSAEAREYWAGYLLHWTRWNHVRTAASATAAVCFALAGATLT